MEVSSSYVLRGIRAYKNEYYFPPQANWPKHQFKKRCYEEWAIEEAERRIIEGRSWYPVSVVEDFYQEACECLQRTNNNANEELFMIVVETLGQLVDYLHCMCK